MDRFVGALCVCDAKTYHPKIDYLIMSKRLKLLETNDGLFLETSMGKHELEYSEKPGEDSFYCRYSIEPKTGDEEEKDLSISIMEGIYGNELPEDVQINFYYKSKIVKPIFLVYFARKEGVSICKLYYSIGLDEWSYSINIKGYADELTKLINMGTNYSANWEFSMGDLMGNIAIELEDNSLIDGSFNNAIASIEKIHETVIKKYSYLHEVIAQFEFTEANIHIYSQYLVYFGEFLKNIGIDSNTIVRTDNNTAILSVVPKNQKHALEEIYSALAVYIGFPSDNEILQPKEDIQSQIRYQQLEALVQHLESQLKLSNALVNVQQREITLIDSTKILNIKTEQKVWEPLSGVRINKVYKGKYFEINFEKLLKIINK